MEATGIFTQEMKDFFKAEEGAFTSFTQVELDKGTYNVKSVIKKLLIERMGRENIPVVNVTESQAIEFIICPKAKIYGQNTLCIPCKFSKKDKEEMTIYFNSQLTSKIFNAEAGDVWYIYFEENSSRPVLGVLSREKWCNLFEIADDEEIVEPDEGESRVLNYQGAVEQMILNEVKAPTYDQVPIVRKEGKTVKSISAEEAARREHNRKKKGNRGEEIAIEIEKRRLLSINRGDLISKITHVAKVKDGLGYDIISTDVTDTGEEREIYIEVKATAGDVKMPFYVSARELEVSQRYRDLYYIYRIFNMCENRQSAGFYRLCGAIDENFNLIATDYVAYRTGEDKE